MENIRFVCSFFGRYQCVYSYEYVFIREFMAVFRACPGEFEQWMRFFRWRVHAWVSLNRLPNFRENVSLCFIKLLKRHNLIVGLVLFLFAAEFEVV